MHLKIESDSKEAIANVVAALLQEKLPEDEFFLASFGNFSDSYWLTADITGPELLEIDSGAA